MGIDLGTTHSVVAVPEVVVKAGTALPDLGVTVITDRHRRRTFPSVVALGPGGDLIAGHRAKQMAGTTPGPIMFAKRQMGTNVVYRLGAKQLRPQDVSAQVLRHLKSLAEERLQQPVGSAVITVPAYFDHLQQAATREAAELAGLEASAIILEPVAAALSYLAGDDRDPLRVLIYDLGGGTFDVTVLEKRSGEFQVLAFGGDPFLGGYDFDRALVGWLCGRLEEDGYRLEFDLEGSAEDRANFAKLMVQVAEPAKIALSSQVEVHLRHPAGTLFADKNGEPVQLDLYLAREDFEACIRGQAGDGGREHCKTVERTIELCRATLQKAGLSEGALDEIILVGGSSYIPLVQRRIEEEFGRKPRLFEPDLAVGIGAALKATQFTRQVVEGTVRVFLVDRYPRSVPPETREVDVAGWVELGEPGTHTVTLRREDGREVKQVVSAENNRFLLPSELMPGGRTAFDLLVTDPAGREVARQTLEIRPAEAEGPVQLPVSAADTYITKPFYVETVHGLELIAEEGTALPYAFRKTFHTAGEGWELHVPIWEEDREIGRIKVPGLEGLPVGSPVEVRVDFGADFRVYGEAYVPPPFDRKGAIDIELPPVEVPPLEDLRREFRVLKDRFDEALQQCPDPNVRLKHGTEGKRTIASLAEMLDQPGPDKAQIARGLTRLRGTVRQLGRVPALKPSWEEFEKMLGEARDLLTHVEKEDVREQERAQIEALERHGREFYEKRDEANWAMVCQTLEKLVNRLRHTIWGGVEDLPPEVLVYLLYRQCNQKLEEIAGQVRQLDRTKPQVKEVERQLEEVAAALKRVNVHGVASADAQRVLAELRHIYAQRLEPLEARVEILAKGGVIIVD